MSELGQMVKELRHKHGFSLQKLADKANMSKMHILDIERGRSDNPHVSVLKSLAKALGVAPGDLFDAAIRERA